MACIQLINCTTILKEPSQGKMLTSRNSSKVLNSMNSSKFFSKNSSKVLNSINSSKFFSKNSSNINFDEFLVEILV